MSHPELIYGVVSGIISGIVSVAGMKIEVDKLKLRVKNLYNRMVIVERKMESP